MRKQDFLVHLIKTLTPAEQRYFKLLSSLQGGEKEYLRLFELLEGKSEYDGKTLQKGLGITDAVLVERKRYLTQLILKSMRNADEPSWKQPKFEKTVMDAENLVERGLLEPALAILEKAIADARYLESFASQIQLLGVKRRVLVRLQRANELTDLQNEVHAVAEALLEHNDLLILAAQCHNLEIEGKNQQKIKLVLKHPLMQKKPSELLSVKAGVCWFTIYQFVYLFQGNNKKLLEVTRQTVSHFEANPQFLDMDAKNYTGIYVTLAQAETNNGNYSSALEVLKTLDPILQNPPQYLSPKDLDYVSYYARHARVTIAKYLTDYEQAVQLGYALYDNKAIYDGHQRFVLMFDLAVALLQTRNAKKACDVLNELLQLEDDLREDLQIYIRPMMVLVQFELGNYTVIPYLIKSTKSWMKRNKLKNESLEVFFHYAYVIAMATEPARRGNWLKLKKALDNQEIQDFDKEFNLKFWLANKLARPA